MTTEDLRNELNKLSHTDVAYLRDLCDDNTQPPEDYFIGLAANSGATNDTEYLLQNYPDAVQRFVELSELHFQAGNLAKSGIIDELGRKGYDKGVLKQPAISDSFERLLLISLDAFYDTDTDTISHEFDILVGRAQIQHERTDSRYKFDAEFPIDDEKLLSDRINKFEEHQNQSGSATTTWHGTTDSGFWVKLFKQRNPKSEYIIESEPSSESTPTVSTETRYPVKTFSAEIRETDDGVIIHTFDNLEGSGMKTAFQSFLKTVSNDESEFDSFTPIQSPKARNLVDTAVDEAKKAADESSDDEVDVFGRVQESMDDLAQELLDEADDSDDSEDTIGENLRDNKPVFVGFDIGRDEDVGIAEFSVRSEGPFAEFGSQIENFDKANQSLLREVNKENIHLVFRLSDPHSSRPSFFTVTYGDWSDVRGVSQEIYDTLEGLLGDENEE